MDATDLSHAIFTVHETVPVSRPRLRWCCSIPSWLPGESRPQRHYRQAGRALIIHRQRAERIEWKRDPVEVFAYHIDVPPGRQRHVDVDFQFLSAVSTREGRVVMTPEMLSLEWNSLALYPAGYFTRDIKIQPNVKFPAKAGRRPPRWKSPVPGRGRAFEYKTTTFNTLVDSPMIAGKYYQGLRPRSRRPRESHPGRDRRPTGGTGRQARTDRRPQEPRATGL